MSTPHTPTHWHYISGAVYARPEDADAIDRCAIAQRASVPYGLAGDFEPTEKDANMRRIVACVNALQGWSDLDIPRAAQLLAAILAIDPDGAMDAPSASNAAADAGLRLACALKLPRTRSGHDAGRYRTEEHGTKSPAGLARVALRILLEDAAP